MRHVIGQQTRPVREKRRAWQWGAGRMSLKTLFKGLAESAALASAIAWLRRAGAVLRSLLQAVTTPYYRGAVTGGAVAVVTLGLLLSFDHAAVTGSPAGSPQVAALPLQASGSQAAAAGQAS